MKMEKSRPEVAYLRPQSKLLRDTFKDINRKKYTAKRKPKRNVKSYILAIEKLNRDVGTMIFNLKCKVGRL